MCTFVRLDNIMRQNLSFTEIFAAATLLALLMAGCQTEPGKPQEALTDTISLEAPDVQSVPDAVAISPELVGGWIMEKVVTQGAEIPMQGTDTLRFGADGTIVMANPNTRSQGRFSQREEQIDTDLWTKVQRILVLNAQTLQLVDTVDKSPVVYHYRKI